MYQKFEKRIKSIRLTSRMQLTIEIRRVFWDTLYIKHIFPLLATTCKRSHVDKMNDVPVGPFRVLIDLNKNPVFLYLFYRYHGQLWSNIPASVLFWCLWFWRHWFCPLDCGTGGVWEGVVGQPQNAKLDNNLKVLLWLLVYVENYIFRKM